MNAEMTLQLEKRRWWILAVIGLINLCAGSIYAWSVLAAASAAKLSSVLGTAVTPETSLSRSGSRMRWDRFR